MVCPVCGHKEAGALCPRCGTDLRALSGEARLEVVAVPVLRPTRPDRR